MGIQEQFDAAVKIVQALPKEGPMEPSDDQKLKFYSYYKQANFGQATEDKKPGFFDFVGKAKWEAWNKCGDMSKEEAMRLYVEGLKELLSKGSEGTEGELKTLIDNFLAMVK